MAENTDNYWVYGVIYRICHLNDITSKDNIDFIRILFIYFAWMHPELWILYWAAYCYLEDKKKNVLD